MDHVPESPRKTTVGPTRRNMLEIGWYGGMTALALEIFGRNQKDIKFLTRKEDEQVSIQFAEQIKDQFDLSWISLTGEFPRGFENSARGESADQLYGLGNVSLQVANFYEALVQYPPEYYQTLKDISIPWEIIMASNLEAKEDGRWKKVGGIQITTDWESFIALNLIDSKPGETFRFSRLALHHEFWHLASNPKITVRANPKLDIDSQFTEIDKFYGLNPNRYETYQEATTCEDVTPPPGFAECYGEWNPKEDSARIAERLMMGDINLWKRVYGQDKAITEKVFAVIDVYKTLSQGRMDQKFFDQMLRERSIDWGWPKLK